MLSTRLRLELLSKLALSNLSPYYRIMIKNEKKTDTEKQLLQFRHQLHNLLIKFPDVRLAGDDAGDVLAFIPSEESPRTKVYLPRSGKQELITQFALGK